MSLRLSPRVCARSSGCVWPAASSLSWGLLAASPNDAATAPSPGVFNVANCEANCTRRRSERGGLASRINQHSPAAAVPCRCLRNPSGSQLVETERSPPSELRACACPPLLLALLLLLPLFGSVGTGRDESGHTGREETPAKPEKRTSPSERPRGVTRGNDSPLISGLSRTRDRYEWDVARRLRPPHRLLDPLLHFEARMRARRGGTFPRGDATARGIRTALAYQVSPAVTVLSTIHPRDYLVSTFRSMFLTWIRCFCIFIV